MAKKEKIDITKGFYIQNLEANNIYSNILQEQLYDTTNNNKKDLYVGTLSYSLDEIKMYSLHPKEFYITDGKQYTDCFVNINFDYDLNNIPTEKKMVWQKNKIKEVNIRGRQEISKEELRKYFYSNGLTINNSHYKLYKRTASKSRQGSCLFIKAEYYTEMKLWSHLNINFDENEIVDLASLKAYESLSLSAIENIINIKPDQILMIDDCFSEFTEMVSATDIVDKKPVTTNKTITIKNCIWDGESLIDISILPDNKKSMFLLRNKFFKSASFATNITQYFADKNITVIYDKYRKCNIDTKNIKLIITPSSLKLNKFKDKIPNENYFTYWLKNIDSTFGICKNEKQSRYEDRQRLTYQFLNTLPLTKSDVEEIAKDETNYIKALKNNLTVFLDYTHSYEPNENYTFIQNLITVNSEAQYTKEFKEYRRHVIERYINDVRGGHVKIAGADYCILFGNPLEMLNAAAGQEIKPLHSGYEIYCPKFADGVEIAMFRNPHICSGNVLVAKNKYFDDFKYFRLSDNIVMCNGINSDLPDRLQGCDFDSDSALLTNNTLIVNKAKECIKYLTPVKIKKIETKSRENNSFESAEIDNIIQHSQPTIGIICNWSQILNSYYWDEYNKPDCDNEKLDFLYNKISMLSSLSQYEIDRPKKYFSDKEDLAMSAVLKTMSKLKYKGKYINEYGIVSKTKKELSPGDIKAIEELQEQFYNAKIEKNKYLERLKPYTHKFVQRPIRPNFFKYLDGDKNFDFKTFFNCPMDFLQKVLNKKIKNAQTTKLIYINDILLNVEIESANRHQIPNIMEILLMADKNIKSLYALEFRDKREAWIIRKNIIDDCVKDIAKFKISNVTMLCIYKRILNEEGIKNYSKKYGISKITAMGILHAAHPVTSISCFNELKTGSISDLVKVDKDEDYIFWNTKYKVVENAQNITRL